MPSTTTYWYTKAYNRGPFNAYLDLNESGNLVYLGSYNANSSTYGTDDVRRQIGITWDVPYGVHKLKIVFQGTALQYGDVDGFSLGVTSYAGRNDDASAAIKYFDSSTWFLNGASGAYNSSITTSNTKKNFARFISSGNQIRYGYSIAPSRGRIAVTVDGADKGEIDQYASSLARQITYEYPIQYVNYGSGISRSTHIIHLFVPQTKSAASTDTNIDIDFIDSIDSNDLSVIRETQLMTNWCWASMTKSIGHYFTGIGYSQCQIVGAGKNTAPTCNNVTGWWFDVDTALSTLYNVHRRSSDSESITPLSYSKIQDQIKVAKSPIIVGWNINNNAQIWHMGLVYGYREYPLGPQMVKWMDPSPYAPFGGWEFDTYSQLVSHTYGSDTYNWIGSTYNFYR